MFAKVSEYSVEEVPKESSPYYINSYVPMEIKKGIFEWRADNGTNRRVIIPERTEVDVDGKTSSEYMYKEAISGNNISLTIDYNIQKMVEKMQ